MEAEAEREGEDDSNREAGCTGAQGAGLGPHLSPPGVASGPPAA